MTHAAEEAHRHFEVIIVGGGLVGATLAALLGQAGLSVALLDARPESLDAKAVGRGKPAMRVSALTPVSQRLLQGLGAWSWMQARRVTPYHHMQVWDSEGSGEVAFTAEQAGVPVLGHIVENDVILAALEARLAELRRPRCGLAPGYPGWRRQSRGARYCWKMASVSPRRWWWPPTERSRH
ncbi:hypothetical protein Q427_22850 [Halomonas sp. BC04]|nr:hypothetical protein Q427_22850 [Halomonas sp. BC04]